MSYGYTKQIWNDYDRSKTEEYNLANGGIVLKEKMLHIEDGIEQASKSLSTEVNVIGKGLNTTMQVVEEDENRKIVLNLSPYDDTEIQNKVNQLVESSNNTTYCTEQDIEDMFNGTYA